MMIQCMLGTAIMTEHELESGDGSNDDAVLALRKTMPDTNYSTQHGKLPLGLQPVGPLPISSNGTTKN